MIMTRPGRDDGPGRDSDPGRPQAGVRLPPESGRPGQYLESLSQAGFKCQPECGSGRPLAQSPWLAATASVPVTCK